MRRNKKHHAGKTRAKDRRNQKHRFPKIRRRRSLSLTESRLQFVIRQMKSGKSLAESAQQVGLKPERVRRKFTSANLLRKRRGRWVIRDDVPTQMLVYSEGEAKSVIPADARNRSLAGKFMNAVKSLLRTNKPKNVAPFKGRSVRDIAGKRHRLETDPNTLYRLASSASESFEDIYKYLI